MQVLKSVKALKEEREGLAFEAKGIYESVTGASREWREEEEKRFQEITDDKTGLIAQLDQQIKEAEDREEAILKISRQEHRRSTVDRLADITNPDPSRPRRTLDVDNRDDDTDRVYVRTAKLRAFKTNREAYDAGMWMRALVARLFRGEQDKEAELHCHRRGLDISNTATEGVGAGGGYLVPAPVSSAIIEFREKVGVARQVCDIQPMTANTLSIPKRTGGLTVYYPDEASSITDSTKNWGQIELITRKRAVATKISQELQEDALISVVDNAVAEMSYAMALQEDNELINGDGGSSYGTVRGLLSKVGSAGVYTNSTDDRDAWDEYTITDITTFMGKLPDRYGDDAVFICSNNFYWSVFARLAAAAGGNNIGTLEGGPSGKRFLGVPVYTTSQMPTATATSQKCLLYGMFRQAVILGDRTGIRIGRDDSTSFLSDLTTLKATSRYDMHVHEAGNASTAGAYVVLQTNS